MKKNVLFLLLLSVTLLTSQTAIGRDANSPAVPQDPNYVVMVFDGNELTIEQVSFLAPGADFDTVENVADYWLNTQLLYEQALKKGVDKNAKTKFLADMNYKKTIATAIIEQAQNDVKVSDEEIRKYYEANKETDPRLKEPVYLSFSHVTVDTNEQAQDVRNRIEKGEEINELAKELSIANDAQKGGKAGKFREDTVRSRIGQEFLDAMLKASEGDIVGPVKNKDGKYEVARHEGKRAARLIEFDKVKDQIKSSLEGEAKKNAVEKLLNDLKENAANRYKKTGIFSEAEKDKNSEK